MPASHPTNIIFIVIDTHRADRLGLYGCTRGLTPNLDAFGRSAVVFDQAIAPAQWTIPAHASFFTGLPPSTHQVIQANSVLDARFPTSAEILSGHGYDTLGFCNNPLVGLIHNNLRRGYQQFYNYCGAAPDTPPDESGNHRGWAEQTREYMVAAFRKFADPIQNKFATSNQFLTTATHPFFVPLWTKFARYKGDSARSIRDVTAFLRGRSRSAGGSKPPFLLFLNLMEPHLPYLPPREYIARYAPLVKENRQAAEFIQAFNTQAMRWLIPTKEPFTEIESAALGQMYDAEVAYQDHLLGSLFEMLESSALRDESLVIVNADHGEMLGEHRLMGHGFGVYHELIRVPMMIRTPGQVDAWRIKQPVSTTRLFHTFLDAAGIGEVHSQDGMHAQISDNSLLGMIQRGPSGSMPGDAGVLSEAYAPEDAIKMMEIREPELIDPLHMRETHRAIYTAGHKLYAVENVDERLSDHQDGPYPVGMEVLSAQLSTQLKDLVTAARSGQPEGWSPEKLDLSNPLIEQRLRDLGYLA